MTKGELRKIIEKRFREWANKNVSEHTTPAILLSVGHDHASGKWHLCTLRDLSRQDTINALRQVADMMEAGMVVEEGT